MVKSLPPNAGGRGFMAGLGIKSPHAMRSIRKSPFFQNSINQLYFNKNE